MAAGNVETSQRITDVLLGALSRALPDRIPAASSGTMNNLSFGGYDTKRQRPFAYYETIAGGMGAGPEHDGHSATHTHMTNSWNTPAEALEHQLPLRIRSYGIDEVLAAPARREAAMACPGVGVSWNPCQGDAALGPSPGVVLMVSKAASRAKQDATSRFDWGRVARSPANTSSTLSPATSFESKRQVEADMTSSMILGCETNRPPLRVLLEHSVLLVFLCTIIGAAAQVLLKIARRASFQHQPDEMLMNPWLFLRERLVRLSTVLLVLALRKGQLSLLYPVISLTYVWVSILSLLIFKEAMNVYKALGLAIVVAGVAILGRDSRT
jgi:multidrug transporter EmrE-like cation transporter